LRQISDIEIVIAHIQAELNGLAISGRNEYARCAIQKDFAAGIKELDQELVEETDLSSFNPDADDRDYEEVA
jgi:pantothenate synthetase